MSRYVSSQFSYQASLFTVLCPNYIGAGPSPKRSMCLGRFWKLNAGNLPFRPKNQGVFLQNSVDTAFLEQRIVRIGPPLYIVYGI